MFLASKALRVFVCTSFLKFLFPAARKKDICVMSAVDFL